jgi:hypothetical protein
MPVANAAAQEPVAINVSQRKHGVLSETGASIEGRQRMSNETQSSLTIQEAMMEGCFSGATFPLTAIASITTQASKIEFDALFGRWVRRLESRTRLTLGWIKVYRNKPQRHAKIALIANAPLYCSPAEAQWRKIAAARFPGTVKLEPYRDPPCGLGHILGRLDASVENAEFSDNLTRFVFEEAGQGLVSLRRRDDNVALVSAADENGEGSVPPLSKPGGAVAWTPPAIRQSVLLYGAKDGNGLCWKIQYPALQASRWLTRMWLQIAWVPCGARNGNVLAGCGAVETHCSIANTTVATCRIRFDAFGWRVFLSESVPIGSERCTVGTGSAWVT